MLLQPALATQAASVLQLCLRLFFFLFFLFSSLLLLSQASTSRVHLPWSNLSPLPPCLLPCSGLLSSQRLIHSTWRYFAGGGANLVIRKKRLLQPALATQAASVLQLCLRLFFFLSSYSLLFCFSLRLPPRVYIFPWSNLSRFHPVSFHAAVCCQAKGSYIVPGATLPGAVLIWYTINRLLQPALATQAASDLRLCLRLFFFFSSSS